MPGPEWNCHSVAGDRAGGMACALAQRRAELKAKPPRVEPAPYAAEVGAVVVSAANASLGSVNGLELIRPRVAHSRESIALAGSGATAECPPYSSVRPGYT